MNSLTENIISGLLKKHSASFRIFFWGLCKNAGKTTALLHTYAILKKLTNRPIIILSCGYDGEVIDAITGLAKPQVAIHKNDYCITTSDFVSELDFYILHKDNRRTVHGYPVILKAKEETKATIAAVGGNEDIEHILQSEVMPFNTIYLIDGAINRKSFLALAFENDYISVSIGNCFSDDIEEIKDEILLIEELFSLLYRPDAIQNCKLLDTATAATLINASVCVKDNSHIFLTPKEYELFKHNGNCLIFSKPQPQLLWFTFNPYDANKSITGEDYTCLLNEIVQAVPVLNLKKKSVRC